MPPLPFNPWLYIALFIFLTIATQFSPASSMMLWTVGASVLLMTLHLTWIWQALRLIVAVYEPAAKHLQRVRTSLICTVVGLGVTFAIIPTMASSANQPPEPQFWIAFISMFCGVLAFFWTFWSAASALCNAEDRGEPPAIRIVGTFLLCLYLIIGAPFIYKRLKALQLKTKQQIESTRPINSSAPA